MSLLKFFKGTSAQQQYTMGEKIGTGKFSIVYACREKKTNKEYAMKVIESSKLDSEARLLIAYTY
jgi:serine/threonine protein kinase